MLKKEIDEIIIGKRVRQGITPLKKGFVGANIVGFDVEASGSEPYSMQFFSVDGGEFVWIKGLTEKELLEMIFDRAKRGLNCVFAHNLEYDLGILFRDTCYNKPTNFYGYRMKVIYPDSTFMKVTDKDNNKTIQFMDSMAFFQASLKRCAEQFNISVKKLEPPDCVKAGKFPSKAELEYLKEYAVIDAQIAYELGYIILQWHEQYDVPITWTVSPATMASKIIRRMFLKDRIPYQHDWINSLGMRAYFGGRTESFIYGTCDCTVYDINCFDDETEIFTEDGWKKWNELVVGMNVMSFNSDSEELQMKPIRHLHLYDYDGEMVRMENENIDQLVTPNHRILYQEMGRVKGYESYGKWSSYKVQVADELPSQIRIPVSGKCAFMSSSNKLLDQMQELCFKIGLKCHVNYDNHVANIKENRDGNFAFISRFNGKHSQIRREKYKGKVWCVTVDNSFVLIRRNGKVSISGNSSYPKAFSDIAVPLERRWKRVEEYDGENGFYVISGFMPDMKISPLPMKSRLFYFPVGRFNNVVVTGYELKHILEYAKIERLKGWVYIGKTCEALKDFVLDFYAKKSKFKESGDRISYLFSKNNLNGGYGKLMQKNPLDFSERNVKIGSYDVETEELTMTEVVRRFEAGGMFNPVMAAWVTSCARANLFEFFKECFDDVLYTDTDSLMVRGNPKIKTGKKLGDLDFDTKGKATIIREKLYVINRDDEVVKTGKHGVWIPEAKMREMIDRKSSVRNKSASYKIHRMSKLRESVRQKKLPFVFEEQDREISLAPSSKRSKPVGWKYFDYENDYMFLKPIKLR